MDDEMVKLLLCLAPLGLAVALAGAFLGGCALVWECVASAKRAAHGRKMEVFDKRIALERAKRGYGKEVCDG